MAAIINGKKTFIPIENNPEVLSHLAQNLGVRAGLTFYDIVDLSDEFLSSIPRPVHSLIFLCSDAIFRPARDQEKRTMPEYTGHGDQEPVLWFKQTLGHACGLMALLHCLANGEARKSVPSGCELDNLFNEAVSLPPAPRAKLLYDSEFIERAHMAAAVQGSSSVPRPADPVGFHYIAFVKDENQHLWELNGSMKGPVDRGFLGDEDLLSRKALDLSVVSFLTGGENIGVSIVALGD